MSRVLIPATYIHVIRASRLSVRDMYASRIFDWKRGVPGGTSRASGNSLFQGIG